MDLSLINLVLIISENVRLKVGRQVEPGKLVIPYKKLTKIEKGTYVWVTDGENDTLEEVITNDPFLQQLNCMNENKEEKCNKYESIVGLHKVKSKTRKRKVSFYRNYNL